MKPVSRAPIVRCVRRVVLTSRLESSRLASRSRTHLVPANRAVIHLPRLSSEARHADLLSKRDKQVLVAHGDASILRRGKPIVCGRRLDKLPSVVGAARGRRDEDGVRPQRIEREGQCDGHRAHSLLFSLS